MAKRRNIRVHGVRRKEPDLRKLSRALLALAEVQHEAEAQAAHQGLNDRGRPQPPMPPVNGDSQR